MMVGGGGVRMRHILVKIIFTRSDFCLVGLTALKTKDMVKKAMCTQAMQVRPP